MDIKAHGIVQREVKRGNLVRPDKCSECGKISPDREVLDRRCLEGKRIVPGIQAHHADYTKPTEVEWLCSKCHGKRRISGPVRRIAIYMTITEYEWVKLQAGDVPLSKWCHKRVMKDMKIDVNGAGEMGLVVQHSDSDTVKSSAKMSTAPTKNNKSCPHGKGKGDNCWQCGGLAKIV